MSTDKIVLPQLNPAIERLFYRYQVEIVLEQNSIFLENPVIPYLLKGAIAEILELLVLHLFTLDLAFHCLTSVQLLVVNHEVQVTHCQHMGVSFEPEVPQCLLHDSLDSHHFCWGVYLFFGGEFTQLEFVIPISLFLFFQKQHELVICDTVVLVEFPLKELSRCLVLDAGYFLIDVEFEC